MCLCDGANKIGGSHVFFYEKGILMVIVYNYPYLFVF